MTNDEAVAALDAINPDDPNEELEWPGPGGAHAKADEIILATLPPEIRAAYGRLIGRCGWWAYS